MDGSTAVPACPSGGPTPEFTSLPRSIHRDAPCPPQAIHSAVHRGRLTAAPAPPSVTQRCPRVAGCRHFRGRGRPASTGTTGFRPGRFPPGSPSHGMPSFLVPPLPRSADPRSAVPGSRRLRQRPALPGGVRAGGNAKLCPVGCRVARVSDIDAEAAHVSRTRTRTWRCTPAPLGTEPGHCRRPECPSARSRLST